MCAMICPTVVVRKCVTMWWEKMMIASYNVLRHKYAYGSHWICNYSASWASNSFINIHSCRLRNNPTYCLSFSIIICLVFWQWKGYHLELSVYHGLKLSLFGWYNGGLCSMKIIIKTKSKPTIWFDLNSVLGVFFF